MTLSYVISWSGFGAERRDGGVHASLGMIIVFLGILLGAPRFPADFPHQLAELDGDGDTRFAGGVRRLISQALVIVIVALSLVGGGHAHALHPADTGTVVHVHSYVHGVHKPFTTHAYSHQGAGLVYHAAHPDGGPQAPTSDQCDCCLAASCCVHAAPLPAATALTPIADAGPAFVARDAHVPYGQLSHPPLRPPRFAA